MDDITRLYQFPDSMGLGPAEDYPVGSVEWAERISARLQIETRSITSESVRILYNTIRAIWDARPRPWDIWPQPQPFLTPDDYCLNVTGHTWNFLVGTVLEFRGDNDLFSREMLTELARTQAEHRSQGTRTDQHHSIGMKLSRLDQGGNQRSYLLRRLARDYGEILAAYERGEFKSVRSAAKAAGIVKDLTPFEQILKLLPKLTDEERADLIFLVLEQTHWLCAATLSCASHRSE